MMYNWKTIGLMLTVLAIAVLGFLPARAAEESNDLAQMVDEAQTPTDHKALAEQYKNEAQAARQKQAEHERMRAAYTKRYPTKRTAMVSHCYALIKKYEEMAAEYEALATLHSEMASSTQ